MSAVTEQRPTASPDAVPRSAGTTVLEIPVRQGPSRPPEIVRARQRHHWAWLGAGLVLAFLIPYVFADLLAVPRDGYYAIYVVSVLTFTAAWLRGTAQRPQPCCNATGAGASRSACSRSQPRPGSSS
jgi:hypothetical protein